MIFKNIGLNKIQTTKPRRKLFMEDVRHNCGLLVAHTLHDAYKMIRSLQHRGREATGIAAIGLNRIDVIKWKGPVGTFDIVDLNKIFPGNNYHTYLVHVRYATRGRKKKILVDAHPHTIGGKTINRGNHIIINDCEMVAVHNGQVNSEYLNGINKLHLNTGCDTEALLHYYKENGEHALLRNIPGAYTLAIADKKRSDVIVMRDRTGIKPGVLGWKDGKYGIASEDIAFRKNGGEFIEDLDPGTIYYLSPDGKYRKQFVMDPQLKYCYFEYNYIAHADSILNGFSVRTVREILGEMLGIELGNKLKNIDLITFLPRCPEVAARRLAKKSGIEFAPVFYKIKGERSFQGSTKKDRRISIEQNLHLLTEIAGYLRGKLIVSVDDSTIRGNNSKRARKLFYEDAGVKKVLHANYTPPVGIIGKDGEPRGCEYGVDMPPSDNFIARGRTIKQISQELGMPTFYLSVEGMLKGFERAGIPRKNLCYFCIGGKRPF
jgi:amidophosphoribosyltransferase